ncbi:hypothetical protein PN499_12445 [Kamptonema animale CS-326]|nr:hypothetical protein [Kamptonema animale]MDB9511997.1 hypothetical protein [Kamptonema animale CS-326]
MANDHTDSLFKLRITFSIRLAVAIAHPLSDSPIWVILGNRLS